MRLFHLILLLGTPRLVRVPFCAMTDLPGLPPDRVLRDISLFHAFKNHLSVIIGFCDLLLNDLPEDDPKRADILEVRKAGEAAIALLPELSERLR